MEAQHFRNLMAYKKAFALAMEIFQISKTFPKEEKYGLPVQIGDRPGGFVQVSVRHIESVSMKHILSANHLMPIQKILRQDKGLARFRIGLLLYQQGALAGS